MSLTLCLHASASRPRVYLLDGETVLEAADDMAVGSADPTTGPSLAELVERRLAAAGATPAAIERIAVDVGPGRLSAVRAAVSFANALAFALGRPILPIVSSHAAGRQAWRRHGRPAIVVHKAAAGAAYVGRVEDGTLTALRYGPLAPTLVRVAAGLDALALVGEEAEAICDKLRGVDIAPAGDPNIEPATFVDILRATPAGRFVAGPVHPITEQSDEVND